jgi:HME family heavy-metal exporter
MSLALIYLRPHLASMVDFIALTEIATRNGLLKANQYIKLCRLEGETFGAAMIVGGSATRSLHR